MLRISNLRGDFSTSTCCLMELLFRTGACQNGKFSVVSLVLWLLPSVCLFPGFYWRNSASADLVGRCAYMQYGHGELNTTLNFELFLIVSWRFKRKIITTFDNLLAEEYVLLQG